MTALMRCRCGADAPQPPKRRPLEGGFVLRCTSAECPAQVAMPSAAAAMERWNEMATRLNGRRPMCTRD